jgi:hypothetical protein
MPSMPKSQRLRGRGLGSDHKRGRLDLLMELAVANSSGVEKPANIRLDTQYTLRDNPTSRKLPTSRQPGPPRLSRTCSCVQLRLSFLCASQRPFRGRRPQTASGRSLVRIAGATAPLQRATEVIRGLPMNYNITVVTNTVNVAMELSKRRDVYVFVTGGHLHGEWFSLVG